LPGNGLDDDCTAGDAELSDTSAIWVDGNAGQGSDDTGLGTREQPFASLKTATACATQSLGAAHPAKDRCKGTFLVIVLAQTPEDTPYAPPGVPTPISVLGGFRGKANGFAAIPDNPIAAKHPGAARIAGGGLSVATGTRVAFANLEIDAYSVGAPLSSPRAVSLGAGARATILRSDLDARGQSQAYGISADPAGETPTRLVLERSRVFAQGGNYSQGVTPNGAALTVSNSRIDAQGPGYAWAIYVTSTQDTTVSVTRSELSAHDANYCSAIEAANSQVKTPLLVEQSTLRTGGECGYATGVSGAQATRLLVERSVIDLDNENEARSTYGYGVYADRADLVSSVIRLRVANGRCAYMANEAGPTAAVGTLNMIGSVCDVRPRTARIGVEANGPVIILNSAFVGFPETTDYSRASLQVRAAQRLVLAGNVFTHSSCVAAFPDASEPACVSLAELAKCDSAIWPCDADKDLARDNRALADPGFVDGDGTYTSRYGLTSESGLRGAGVSPVTLTDVYADEDLAGALRSEDGSWDSGAREYTATTP
jgi:hypothetical protein